MTGSPGCFGTRRQMPVARPLFLVHISPPRNPFYGRIPVEDSPSMIGGAYMYCARLVVRCSVRRSPLTVGGYTECIEEEGGRWEEEVGEVKKERKVGEMRKHGREKS